MRSKFLRCAMAVPLALIAISGVATSAAHADWRPSKDVFEMIMKTAQTPRCIEYRRQLGAINPEGGMSAFIEGVWSTLSKGPGAYEMKIMLFSGGGRLRLATRGEIKDGRIASFFIEFEELKCVWGPIQDSPWLVPWTKPIP